MGLIALQQTGDPPSGLFRFSRFAGGGHPDPLADGGSRCQLRMFLGWFCGKTMEGFQVSIPVLVLRAERGGFQPSGSYRFLMLAAGLDAGLVMIQAEGHLLIWGFCSSIQSMACSEVPQRAT